MARVRKSLSQNGIAQSLDKVVGMQLRRPVAAGSPLRLEDLMRPALVQRGSVVRIELQSSDLSVSGSAVALEAGAAGDVIRVQPKYSSSLVTAQIIAPEVVRVIVQPGGAVNQSVHFQ
jgi:flagella basal body P-ring formation protein FlgA